MYAPRSLRKELNSVDQAGNVLYGDADLKIANNVEVASSDHSPIIGWAYDGYPIYGPYGYVTKSGGVVAQMKSGYKLNLQSNRPPTSLFPEGFFIEDYTHSELSDETVLDVNNGDSALHQSSLKEHMHTLQPLIQQQLTLLVLS